MKYFNRSKYRKIIITNENLEKFKKIYPDFAKYPNSKLKKYWKFLYVEAVDEMIRNIAGIELPFYLGNLSIRALDIDFKGHLDIPQSAFNKKLKLPRFIHTSHRMKIVWKKHLLFKSFSKSMGVEICKFTKSRVSDAVSGKENYYQKAYKHDKIPSKHKEIFIEKSLFDSA